MRVAATALLLAGLGAFVAAQSTADQRAVLDANKAWFDAFVRGDADAMDKIETADFVFIQDGLIEDKAQQLADIRKRAGRPLEQTHRVDLHRFARSGNVAIVTGHNVITTATDSGRVAFSEVWVRDGSLWRVAQAHYSAAR
jgi:ketosteroid isomerase-like protein